MKLLNKVAVVAGGTGSIGEGIVRRYLQEGATVIVPSRSLSRIDSLQGYVSDITHGILASYQANIGTFLGAQEFIRNILEDHGKIDICIASIGVWWSGKSLSELSNDDWHDNITNNLHPHFYLARAVLPAMQEARSGLYVGIAGPANIMPVRKSEILAVTGAAHMKMLEAFATEMRAHAVNVYQLIVADVATRQAAREKTASSITPEEIADYTLRLYTGDVPEPSNYLQKFMRVTLPWLRI
ncbi:MAG: SDR family oxidoreductase [Bacteroidota bacterium]|nr:SDR family oxidoreductase [Candidatus Kapabacteria bacterium]MDW8219839.1 SDR family oxidoreductase [Bacteroidota bacterium]